MAMLSRLIGFTTASGALEVFESTNTTFGSVLYLASGFLGTDIGGNGAINTAIPYGYYATSTAKYGDVSGAATLSNASSDPLSEVVGGEVNVSADGLMYSAGNGDFSVVNDVTGLYGNNEGNNTDGGANSSAFSGIYGLRAMLNYMNYNNNIGYKNIGSVYGQDSSWVGAVNAYATDYLNSLSVDGSYPSVGMNSYLNVVDARTSVQLRTSTTGGAGYETSGAVGDTTTTAEQFSMWFGNSFDGRNALNYGLNSLTAPFVRRGYMGTAGSLHFSTGSSNSYRITGHPLLKGYIKLIINRFLNCFWRP